MYTAELQSLPWINRRYHILIVIYCYRKRLYKPDEFVKKIYDSYVNNVFSSFIYRYIYTHSAIFMYLHLVHYTVHWQQNKNKAEYLYNMYCQMSLDLFFTNNSRPKKCVLKVKIVKPCKIKTQFGQILYDEKGIVAIFTVHLYNKFTNYLRKSDDSPKC